MEKKKLKLRNKQFYKYWKKVVREWNGFTVQERKSYRDLKNLSIKNNTPIDEMVSRLLIQNKESIFKDDFIELSEWAMLDLSYENIVSLLYFSGYEKKEDYYYLVEDRRWKIINACNATKCCEESDSILGFGDRINIIRRNYYLKKQEKYQAKSDVISLKYKANAFKVDPANGERISSYSSMFSKIMIGMVILLGGMILIWIIRKYSNLNGTDEKTLDFCNTLLAASLPCFATLITTYLLIQHEYKVDYHRERMSSLPIFKFEHVDKDSLLKKNKKDCLRKKIKSVFFDTAYMDIKNSDYDVYKLSNIGYGIGFNVRHNRGDEIFSFGDIAQGEYCFIGMKKYSSLGYTIEYTDIYGNKYTQSFEVDRNGTDYSIITYPPELVLRTKRLRYQQ